MFPFAFHDARVFISNLPGLVKSIFARRVETILFVVCVDGRGAVLVQRLQVDDAGGWVGEMARLGLIALIAALLPAAAAAALRGPAGFFRTEQNRLIYRGFDEFA